MGWQAVELRNHKGDNYGKWGGANDGQWHDPLTEVTLVLAKSCLKDDDLQHGRAFFADIALEK